MAALCSHLKRPTKPLYWEQYQTLVAMRVRSLVNINIQILITSQASSSRDLQLYSATHVWNRVVSITNETIQSASDEKNWYKKTKRRVFLSELFSVHHFNYERIHVTNDVSVTIQTAHPTVCQWVVVFVFFCFLPPAHKEQTEGWTVIMSGSELF